MDRSAELHLQEIYQLSNTTSPGGFSPIGPVVAHLIDLASIQERRISTLEKEVEELNTKAHTP